MEKNIIFCDVMYILEMKENLFPVKLATEKDFTQTIEGNKWKFMKNNKLIAERHQ